MTGADHLSTGEDVDADVDGQPVRTRAHPGLCPCAVVVQLRGERDQLRRGRVNPRSEHTDAPLKLHTGDVLHSQIIPNICSSRCPEQSSPAPNNRHRTRSRSARVSVSYGDNWDMALRRRPNATRPSEEVAPPRRVGSGAAALGMVLGAESVADVREDVV